MKTTVKIEELPNNGKLHSVPTMKALLLGILFVGISTAAWSAEAAMRLDLGAGTAMDLILVSAGEFTQGSPADEKGRGSDEIQRTVQLTHDYYISKTAVTRGQWERFVAETGYRSEAETGKSGGFGWDGSALAQRKDFTWKNPGFPQDATHPVCLVTYPDAQAFCEWLGKMTRRRTQLPTEAQWEYVCRAGSTTPWHSGTEPTAWHKGNSGNGTHPADSVRPNAWGLVIGGNVAEWCLDWYGPYDAGRATDPLQDNQNLSDKPRRVLRGGSWNRDAKNTRSAARFRADPRSRNADIGFRIVCETGVMPAVAKAPLADVQPAPAEVDSVPSQLTVELPVTRSNSSSDMATPQVEHMIPGWLFLLIPIGIIFIFIRLITRRSGNPFTAAPMPQRDPPPPPRVSQSVRTVDDGFWINPDLPTGTPIHLSYLINGVMDQQTLAYQPGNGGQFIFTGHRPENVSMSEIGTSPPQPQFPHPLPPQPLSDWDDDSFPPSVVPTFNPPAY